MWLQSIVNGDGNNATYINNILFTPQGISAAYIIYA